MKISAYAIAEALSPIGQWELRKCDGATEYSFPRRFAGEGGAASCVTVTGPGEKGAVFAENADVLRIFTGPDAVPEGYPKAALVPSVNVPEEKIWDTVSALFDRIGEWADSLSGCSCDMNGIQEMLDISAKTMGGDFTLIDVSYNIPAYTKVWHQNELVIVDGRNQRATDETIATLADNPALTKVRSVRGVELFENEIEENGAPPVLFRNMFRKGESVYYNRLLFLKMSGEYTQTDRFMMEHLARMIERITEHLPTYAVPVSEYTGLKHELQRLADTAGKKTEPDPAVLSPLGWKADDCYRFYIFRSVYSQRDAGITDYILRRLEHIVRSSCCAAAGEYILMLQNVTSAKESFSDFRPRLAQFLGQNLYKTGISNEFRSFAGLGGAFAQARAALDLGGKRNPMFWYYFFEDYLCDYMIEKSSEEMPEEMLLLPALDTLQRYDALHGTQYMQTLKAYTEANFNATHAASKLYIHRSTFQDRMERITVLTGIDTEDGAVRTLLWLGFHLLQGVQ